MQEPRAGSTIVPFPHDMQAGTPKQLHPYGILQAVTRPVDHPLLGLIFQHRAVMYWLHESPESRFITEFQSDNTIQLVPAPKWFFLKTHGDPIADEKATKRLGEFLGFGAKPIPQEKYEPIVRNCEGWVNHILYDNWASPQAERLPEPLQAVISDIWKIRCVVQQLKQLGRK